jgi:uncharacterized glyoxalase superfamily protein PhnB
MKLLNLRPMIWVDDVKATIDWYVNTLGFENANYVQDWQWGVVTKDEVEIMFAKPNEHIPCDGPKFTGSFYFNTDNVDALWQKFKDSSFICYPPETFEWEMKEFAIKDPNGYILQFGQDVSQTD